MTLTTSLVVGLSISTVAGSASALQGHPGTDELLVSAFSSNSFTRYASGDGEFELAFGPSPLAGTLGAALGPDGAVHVCSETTNEVLRFDVLTGTFLGPFIADDPGTPGDETGGLAGPSGIVFGPDGMAYVASFNSDAVLRYDGRTGAFDSVFVQPNAGGLNGPDAGLAFGPNGDLYVPSFWTDHVKRFAGSGGTFVENFTSFPASGLVRPRTVLFAGDGLVYVTSEGSHEVLELTEAGVFLRALVTDDPGTPVDETGGLDGPTGVAIGPAGDLYVASIGTDEVLRYDRSSGDFVAVFVAAGSGGIDAPTFLAFRPRAGSYCPGAPNSSGLDGILVASGFTSVAADRFTLRASFCPAGETGVFFHGPREALQPLGAGTLCVGGDLVRLSPVQLNGAGFVELAVPLGGVLAPGTTRHFQFWYRDGGTSNLTNALRTTFQP
ncbi:MAG: hypothetical protein GY711_26100 [bacterium]|nr:hypothetical protein [bacterium]